MRVALVPARPLNGVAVDLARAPAAVVGARISPVRRDGAAINGSIECLKWSAIAGVDGSVDVARSSNLVDAI